MTLTSREVSVTESWQWIVKTLRLLKHHPLPAFVCAVGYLAFYAVCSLVPYVGGFVWLFFMPMQIAGYSAVYIAIIRNEKIAFSTFFEPLQTWGTELGNLGAVGFIAGGPCMNVGLPYLAARHPDMALLFGFLAVVFLLMLFFFAPLLVSRHESPVFASLGRSFTACLKNWKAFMVMVVCMGLLLGIIALVMSVLRPSNNQSLIFLLPTIPLVVVFVAIGLGIIAFSYLSIFSDDAAGSKNKELSVQE